MSLLCGNCENDIEAGKPLYAVSYGFTGHVTAACGECISLLPESVLIKGEEKLSQASVSPQVYVFRGESTEGALGSYSLLNFQNTREVLFAVNPRLFRKYLKKMGDYFAEEALQRLAAIALV